MKLIWITPECPYPPNSGGRNVVWNRIVELSENNEIFLYSLVENEKDYEYIPELNKVCKTVSFYKREKNVGVFIKSIFSPFVVVSRTIDKMKKDIEMKCNEITPDFIIVDFPQMLCNIENNLFKKYKVILCQHNIEFLTLKNISNGINNPIKKIAYRLMSLQMKMFENGQYRKNRFSLVTFVSINDKNYFEKKFKNINTYLFPIGANITEKISFEGENIAFVAKMSYLPNEQAAIWFIENVWEKVYKENKNCKFYIVGKEPSNNLISVVEKYENIVITGKVDSVDEYYKKAKIIIIPLFSGGGVKVKLLEALGKGKLVITTSKGIEGTNFVKDKHVIVCDTADEFVSECNNVMKNFEKYKKILECSHQKMCNEFSWRHIVNMFERELIEMVDKNEE